MADKILQPNASNGTERLLVDVPGDGSYYAELFALAPAPLGTLTSYVRHSTADTNLATVKAAPGAIFGYYLFNLSGALKYVKIYNKASNPVLASDTPALIIPLPAGGGANMIGSQGIKFTTGIALAITGGVADTNTTALAVDDVIVDLLFT